MSQGPRHTEAGDENGGAAEKKHCARECAEPTHDYEPGEEKTFLTKKKSFYIKQKSWKK